MSTRLDPAAIEKYMDRLDIRTSLHGLQEIAAEKAPRYDPLFGPLMFAYFDRKKTRTVTDTFYYKNGQSADKERVVANEMPHFTEFARSIRVSENTIKGWAKKHAEFREYYDMCKEIYEEFLIHNGLSGEYNAAAMTFVATNKTKMKNKVINENRTVDINEILNQIERGAKPNELNDGNIIDI